MFNPFDSAEANQLEEFKEEQEPFEQISKFNNISFCLILEYEMITP
jgi:hypothetical protein